MGCSLNYRQVVCQTRPANQAASISSVGVFADLVDSRVTLPLVMVGKSKQTR